MWSEYSAPKHRRNDGRVPRFVVALPSAEGLALAAGYEKLARRAEAAKAEVPATSTDVYRSSNGDRWRLITETPVEERLAVNGPGPEHEALRRLLGRSGVA